MTRVLGTRSIASFTVVLLGTALLATAPPRTAAQEGTSHRDSYQRPDEVAKILGAEPGAHVADIGAGGGYFTHHLRRVVGPDGRVYAVDISRGAVARLRGQLDLEGARNVDVVLGEPDDPRLPFGSLDGALIVNAYHEMAEYEAMLAAIRQALRPGGRLVILDNPPRDTAASRAAQAGDHVIAIGRVAAELRAAGFEIERRDPGFIADTADGHAHRMWLLAARRPLAEPPLQRFPGAPPGAAGEDACPFFEPVAELAERLSPPDSVTSVVGRARVKVCYSRPGTRGRTIMGELVPYDEPWRTGANEATVLRTDHPLDVGGVRLDPGWYSLYAVPGPETWTVVLNRLADRDGAPIDEWVRSHDIGRVTVPVQSTDAPVERLTLRFDPDGPSSAALVLEWERTRVRIPLAPSS